jgi:hypothetical protein
VFFGGTVDSEVRRYNIVGRGRRRLVEAAGRDPHRPSHPDPGACLVHFEPVLSAIRVIGELGEAGQAEPIAAVGDRNVFGVDGVRHGRDDRMLKADLFRRVQS